MVTDDLIAAGLDADALDFRDARERGCKGPA